MIKREIFEKIKPWFGDEKIKLNIVFTKDYINLDKETNCFFIPVILMPFVDLDL